MGYDKVYDQLHKGNQRLIDKELGIRYHSSESIQGETFTEFKKRIIREEMQSLQEQANKVYPAWVKMPNETEEEFRKRLVSKRPNDPKIFPAWKRMPNEQIEEFKKRFTSKKLDKSI